MMFLSLQRRFALVLALFVGMGSSVPAVAQQGAAADEAAGVPTRGQFVDGIAAVVNKQVITLMQVDKQADRMRLQLQSQKIEVPDKQTLRRQVLQRMITDELIKQEADRRKITVSPNELDQAMRSIAERNKLSAAQLRSEVEKSGTTWKEYQDSLRDELRIDKLRQQAVDSNIIISDAEVDAYLKRADRSSSRPVAGPSPAASGSNILGLAQILVAVPEQARADQVMSLRKKAEALLARVRSGADFASVAVSSSDAPEALDGGELGVRTTDGWPDLFIEAVRGLQAGEISAIVQSGQGFHILKVLTRGPDQPAAKPAARPHDLGAADTPSMPDGPMLVKQTHAQHILIKVNQAMTEERALERLRLLQQRLSMGEDFADLAKRHSEDSSAPQGGDLGWITPGETVPTFESAMDALQPGEVSEPVTTQYGLHLIKVLERREKDMETEYRRMQARQAIFQRRAEPAFEDWLSQLRGQAYVDNRLEPSNRSGRR